MSNPQSKCSAMVYSIGNWRATECGNKGKVERDGKWFCGTHDPVAQALKRSLRDKQWETERAAQSKADALTYAAPDLLKACKAAAKLMSDWGIIGEEVDECNAAIATAEGKA
jgi:hypothetical protein